MLQGWIKLHRQLLDHWSASEPEMLATWVRLLLEANHKDTKTTLNGSLVSLKRGQLIFGYNAFSSKSGVTKKKLERYMKLFETEGMLERQRGNKYSIITISCYEDFQDRGDKGEAEGKPVGGQGEHRKNDKNGKNEKKPSSSKLDTNVIQEIWNKACEEWSTATTRSRVFNDKLEPKFRKLFKIHSDFRKKSGKETDLETFCGNYFNLLLEYCEEWAGKGKYENIKIDLAYASRQEVYTRTIDRAIEEAMRENND